MVAKKAKTSKGSTKKATPQKRGTKRPANSSAKKAPSPKQAKKAATPKKTATPKRAKTAKKNSKEEVAEFKSYEGINGIGHVVGGGAAGALAAYPHLRRYNGYLHVSGTSSRRADNTHVGATQKKDGTWDLDIYKQTCAVLENMQRILKTAGADLTHLVECVCYLTDMSNYAGFNKAWNKYITGPTGPSRTTVAVHQLPHPNLLIEIKAVAADPKIQVLEFSKESLEQYLDK
mmetsp:Transcript_30157/g.42059  ORF Transcript_30157/g.42059 Transcript_30157/m.42059 type:complete len:232 (-) Transcript_30157:109-804(-)|eukprot:CAMPEP_0175098966 /NCGR_PEP_ID=MMETSP0086_2-20121207/6173_1 /TAXON_ID=136419 /ORGANISM="Unknown Unknown, Strain D1" /LENGTH=231 /DNA_ID=CAMNT_0016372721 /DNA_START=19 /DNA_END=714 /DNA_ORIENTATION=-